MNAWLNSVVGAVIISAIVSFIMPNGKSSKHIQGIFNLLLILIIVKPIFSVDLSSLNFNDIFNKNEIILQYDFIDYFNENLNEIYTEGCKEIIKNEGIENFSIDIDYETDSDGKYQIKTIKIFLKNQVITEDELHIDIIERIKNCVSLYASVTQDKVLIYDKT